MFFCLPNEWYSDVPYNIRYIIYHGATPPEGSGIYIYNIYIYTDLNGSNLEQLHNNCNKKTAAKIHLSPFQC